MGSALFLTCNILTPSVWGYRYEISLEKSYEKYAMVTWVTYSCGSTRNDHHCIRMSCDVYLAWWPCIHSDSIFGWLVTIGRVMSLTAADALQRAAKRAQRQAELQTAKVIVERALGHELADGEFPWMTLLSHAWSWSLFTNCFCSTRVRELIVLFLRIMIYQL